MFARRRRTASAELSRVQTRDGWNLALYRYRSGMPTSRFGPVLLMHGLGANRYNLDAPVREISLARHLHERGHDVWVAELRGAGRSRLAGWPLRRRASFDFDDYVQKDIPAILRHILDATRSPSVHWVGHSMGGMLAYAAMILFDPQVFRSVVTIASPGFTRVAHPLVDKLYRLRPVLRMMPWLPYKRLGYAAYLFPGLAVRAVGLLAGNAEHLDPAHMRKLGPRVLHDLPATLLDQFADWYSSQTGFARSDKLLTYWENLERVRAPLLLVAGAGDVLTPVSDLQTVFDAVGSTEKELLICGRARGYAVDYGHIDLVLGTHAAAEVYPHIARWIESH